MLYEDKTRDTQTNLEGALVHSLGHMLRYIPGVVLIQLQYYYNPKQLDILLLLIL